MNSPAVLVVVAGQAGAGRERFGAIVSERTGARLLDMAAMMAASDEEMLPDEEDYASLLAVAGKALDAGQSVVVSGPFHSLESRKEVMRIASDAQSALLYVECSANEEVRRRRVRDGLIAAEKLTGLEKRVATLMSHDAKHAELRDEIPRACQMLIDTTVGLALWAQLASCRVEAYVQVAPATIEEPAALVAG